MPGSLPLALSRSRSLALSLWRFCLHADAQSGKHMLTFLIARANNPTMQWTKRSKSGWTLRGCKEVFATITDMIEYGVGGFVN